MKLSVHKENLKKLLKKVLTYPGDGGIINKSLMNSGAEPWKLNNNLEKSECAGQASWKGSETQSQNNFFK